MIRVCPVRILHTGDRLGGTYSPTTRHKVEPTIERRESAVLDGTDVTDAIDTSMAKGFLNRFSGKLMSNYTSRKKFTDQEKAIFYAITFMVVTIAVATVIRLIMS